MQKVYQVVFGALLVVLFLEVWLGFPKHLEDEGDSTPLGATEALELSDSTDQKMSGVHLVESRSGERDWELFAASAEGSSGAGTWHLSDVRVLFYNQEKLELTVVGTKGEISTQTKDIAVRGEVVTKSSNGYKYESKDINYVAAQRKIFGKGPVIVTAPPDAKGGRIRLSSDSLEMNLDESVAYLIGNVAATQKLRGHSDFVVTADQSKLNSKDRNVTFEGSVGMSMGTLKINGPAAEFYYQNGVDFLRSVAVKGGVRVSDIDKLATAESVQFDPEKNTYVFRGKPRLVQDQDEITGDEIIFIDGGKRVRVEKIRAKVDK